MERYAHYSVRYTDADGIQIIRGWGAVNARICYQKWCERVGEDVYRVELIGVDETGIEHVMEHCELRTDLYPKVQAPARETFEQMELL